MPKRFEVNRRIVADQILLVCAETKAEAMRIARDGRPDNTSDEIIVSQTFRFIGEEEPRNDQ